MIAHCHVRVVADGRIACADRFCAMLATRWVTPSDSFCIAFVVRDARLDY